MESFRSPVPRAEAAIGGLYGALGGALLLANAAAYRIFRAGQLGFDDDIDEALALARGAVHVAAVLALVLLGVAVALVARWHAVAGANAEARGGPQQPPLWWWAVPGGWWFVPFRGLRDAYRSGEAGKAVPGAFAAWQAGFLVGDLLLLAALLLPPGTVRELQVQDALTFAGAAALAIACVAGAQAVRRTSNRQELLAEQGPEA